MNSEGWLKEGRLTLTVNEESPGIVTDYAEVAN